MINLHRLAWFLIIYHSMNIQSLMIIYGMEVIITREVSKKITDLIHFILIDVF
jgi:hypothetical protein